MHRRRPSDLGIPNAQLRRRQREQVDLFVAEREKAERAALAIPEQVDLYEDVMAHWAAGKSPKTISEYAADWRLFAAWLGCSSPGEALESLIAGGVAQCNRTLLAYWTWADTEKGQAPKTIRRRLSAIKSVLKMARMIGKCDFTPEVTGPADRVVRDTRGPGEDAIREALTKLYRAVGDETGEYVSRLVATRNLAILRLLVDMGLRSASVDRLRVKDIGKNGPTLRLYMKGRANSQWTVSCPKPTWQALMGWMQVRGWKEGPVFLSAQVVMSDWDEATIEPSTHSMVDQCVRKLGLGHPHGLRHEAIGVAARVCSENRWAWTDTKEFSGHESIASVSHYLDDKPGVQKRVSEAVAETWGVDHGKQVP